MADQMGTGVLGPGLTTALAAKTDKVGGSLTNATAFSTTAACTALLGGAAASAQSSLAISASKTIAVPAAISVWRGLDFQASTLTLAAGGVAPAYLAAATFAAPTISGPYTIPIVATVSIPGPPVAVGGATITTPLALHIEGGNVLCGTGTPDGTATPFHMSFGATYGTNAPGSPGNLKWMLYEGGGHYYGIGMSAGLMEIQADAGAAVVFFQGGSEIVRVTNNVQITSLAGTGTRNVVVDANGVLSAP